MYFIDLPEAKGFSSCYDWHEGLPLAQLVLSKA